MSPGYRFVRLRSSQIVDGGRHYYSLSLDLEAEAGRGPEWEGEGTTRSSEADQQLKKNELSRPEEHPLRRWIGGGGERGDIARRLYTLRRHKGREDAAGPSHPEAPLLRLCHLPRAGGRRRRHGQHGRRRALRTRPHRQLRPP